MGNKMPKPEGRPAPGTSPSDTSPTRPLSTAPGATGAGGLASPPVVDSPVEGEGETSAENTYGAGHLSRDNV
jgi:hypothetical protein